MTERSSDQGPFEYMRDIELRLGRDLDETERRLVKKIELHNKHRSSAIATIAEHVAELMLHLERRPGAEGWVHTRLKNLENAEESRTSTMRRFNMLLIASLIGLIANMAVLIVKLG